MSKDDEMLQVIFWSTEKENKQAALDKLIRQERDKAELIGDLKGRKSELLIVEREFGTHRITAYVSRRTEQLDQSLAALHSEHNDGEAL